jgi:hypothetical protein
MPINDEANSPFVVRSNPATDVSAVYGSLREHDRAFNHFSTTGDDVKGIQAKEVVP